MPVSAPARASRLQIDGYAPSRARRLLGVDGLGREPSSPPPNPALQRSNVPGAGGLYGVASFPVTERSAAELQDEARLIEAAKRDRRAFAALYDRYFDQIYSYCFYHTGNRQAAEDLASDTFQRALEGLAGFEWRPHQGVVDRVEEVVVVGPPIPMIQGRR